LSLGLDNRGFDRSLDRDRGLDGGFLNGGFLNGGFLNGDRVIDRDLDRDLDRGLDRGLDRVLLLFLFLFLSHSQARDPPRVLLESSTIKHH